MLVSNAQKIYDDLAKSKFDPVYFIFGEEPYLKKELLKRFDHYVVDPGTKDFNYSNYFASEVDVHRLLDEAQALPMMSSYRLIIVRNIEAWNDKSLDELSYLFEKPNPSTVLVFTSEKVDKRKKLIKQLLDRATCIEFKKPFDNQVPTWIQHIAKNLDLEVSQDGIYLLHRLIGNQLIEIENELEKLKLYISTGSTEGAVQKKIGVAEIAQVVSRVKEQSIFEFTKSVGENKRAQALENLVQLLDQGQNEIGIINMLARHLRILLLLNKGIENQLNGVRLAHFAQVPAFFLSEYLAQARLWNLKKIERALVILSEVDYALKSSSAVPSHIWLENMVIQIFMMKKS
ncbi:MAG TPA: DNA polymerase III subunit delta [Pseudobdellovibrionaceae bacterium]|nr:DNA polymerase III subunit delta [Pseudobdellovibrionaceae bacterium]